MRRVCKDFLKIFLQFVSQSLTDFDNFLVATFEIQAVHHWITQSNSDWNIFLKDTT